MRIVIFLLFFVFIVLSAVRSEDSDFAPENFGDLFRGGLERLRDLCPRNRDGNQNDDGSDGDNDGSNDDNAVGASDFRKFCGCRLGASSRIIGGKEAAKDSIPWQVSLGRRSTGRHLCGGKLFLWFLRTFEIKNSIT